MFFLAIELCCRISGLSSVLVTLTNNFTVLMLSRFVEGAGFMLGIVSLPMLIAAHSMGYSGIWRTGLISFNKEISKSYGLDDNDIVIGYLYIGTPEKKMTLPIKSNTNDFVINWD